MELNGEVLVDADRERVWAALNDMEFLRACIPGCEEVREESPTLRHARVMIKLGPVRARFTGRVTLSDIDPARACVMAFEGSGGAAGMASGRARIDLQDAAGDAAQGTRIAYAVSASVGGKLGQVGGRLIDASAKQLADQFFTALQSRLAMASIQSDAPVTVRHPSTQGPGGDSISSDASPCPATASLATNPTHAESSRLLWFGMGVAATGLGVWIGAVLF